jgi:poly-gamma-glutamate synthesis protein (capsule biosynthesis protein)
MGHRITVAAVGDIFLGRGVEETINKKGPNYIFESVRPLLLQHHVVFGNLESPAARVETTRQTTGLVAKPTSLEGLKYAGFNAVALANNHIMDFGLPALGDTIAELQLREIGLAGAGLTEAEAQRPLKDIGGQKVTLLSYYGMGKGGNAGQSPGGRMSGSAYGQNGGYNSGHISKILQDIQAAGTDGDVVLVAVHWGVADKMLPMKHQVELARQMIDGGASAVLGSGPHVLQPVEQYNGGIIAYSLGNFVFDHDRLAEQKHSMILHLAFDDGKIESVKITPILISAENRPEPVDPGTDPELYKTIQSLLVAKLDRVESDAAVVSQLRLKSLTPKNVLKKLIWRQHGVYPLSFYARSLVELARERWLPRKNWR